MEKPFENKRDIQTEARMTQVNPLSSIPEHVVGVRGVCLNAFKDAQKAFGGHMGPEFEEALGNLEHADFELSRDEEAHTISTKLASGKYLSLSVDDDSIVLVLVKRDGKKDTITYENGEISRRRMV